MRVLGGIFLLAALVGCSGEVAQSPNSPDFRANLIAERKQFALKNAGLKTTEFECPAEKASEELAENTLIIRVNNRAELLSRTERENLANEFADVFADCGASLTQIEIELSKPQDTFMEGFALALLKQGRGLQ